jgi:hypothetical protein
MSILSKYANPLTTFDDMLSGIENVYEVLSTEPIQTRPACKVSVGVAVVGIFK